MLAVQRKSSWAIFALISAVVIWQVFIPPTIGASDNADFAKMIGWFDLGNPLATEHFARFADLHFVFDPKFHYPSQFYSSELVLIVVALGLNHLIGQPGAFDLRMMGAVHVAVFLFTVYLLLPLLETLPRRAGWILLAAAGVMFTDVQYVAYFNSFFMDTASWLFLLLAVVAYLRARQWQRRGDRWLFVAAAMLLVTSKTQHILLGLPLTMLCWWAGPALASDRGWIRGRRFGAIAATLMLVASLISSRLTPGDYPVFGRYTTIFLKILPGTKDPAGALLELGLDSSYAKYSGTHAYSNDAGLRDPAITADFNKRSGFKQLAWFFARHPDDALRCLEDRLAEAGQQRVQRGNYDGQSGKPDFDQSVAVAYWSGLKSRVFFNHGGRYFAYALLLFAGSVAVAFYWGRTHGVADGIVPGVLALGMMLMLEMLVAGLGDGLDAIRHCLLFHTLADLLVLTGLAFFLLRRMGADRPL